MISSSIIPALPVIASIHTMHTPTKLSTCCILCIVCDSPQSQDAPTHAHLYTHIKYVTATSSNNLFHFAQLDIHFFFSYLLQQFIVPTVLIICNTLQHTIVTHTLHPASREAQNINVPTAAAAGKLLQSCSTLCDPIDGSPPGSPIPGILQARILE